MTTVAEGVESRQQFEALRALGVQEFQGYYFSQPVLVPHWLRDMGERGEPALNLMR
jgi:EAL domain-containing protein (putative c-di-GMP-specific phosphodiesterase class I)